MCYKPRVPSLWLYVLLAVVLESNSADPAQLHWALESCSEALVAQRCAGPDAVGPEPPPFRAQLTFADELHATVAIRRSGSDGELIGERSVTFSPGDPLNERFRALGLIVASYVLAQQPSESAASIAPPPLPAPRFRYVALDIAAVAGPALDRGPPRAGGTLRVFVRPSARMPNFGLLLAARGSHRFADPRLSWASVSAGVVGSLPLLPTLRLEARLEAVGQRLFGAASQGMRVDRKSETRGGGQLGLELFHALSPAVLLFVGGEVARLRPRVTVTRADREVGRDRELEGTLLFGTRIAF